MALRTFTIGTTLLLALVLTACGAASDEPTPAASPPRAAESTSVRTSPAPESTRDEPSVVGTIVRFSAGDAVVDVTIGEDSPATRDFLSMLPMTLELAEFNGREKIAYPGRELAWEGSPGSDPADGDLIYFTPWGNIGFYYDTSGIGYSDDTLHLGTYDATEEELSRFEGARTSVEIVEQ
ncbi:cyclophilin-like fold protein [Microbacterium sp. M28]|uniref:cyclophilin-like fold protein n=1 Tax=Microbacterium sp. M28 TaxID=2962064 RepID=UPI0021F43FA2|nr:cyclophilin-like fold protein [Microbacterium sp. M28]UYO97248.1 cyclophilin-like fold protein [Microbacterium sp. M28]